MGFLGEEPVVTPNLDRLAQQAIVFTQAASNYPVCSPYRAMLMTGQYPHRNGVISNCLSRTAPYGVELKADAECWSDVLKASDYSLGYLGKWHLEAPYKPYIDCANNRISLMLQHNTQNPEQKKGNCVKLTNWTMVEKERSCFEDNHPEFKRPQVRQGQKSTKCDPADWENFIPR